MNIIELELPYPPSVNSYWRHVMTRYNKSVYITHNGVAYREAVLSRVIEYKQARKVLLKSPFFPSERLKAEIFLYPPDNRKRDIDNALKAIFDSLEHASVFLDDSQIDVLLLERRNVIKGGKIYIVISTV